MTTEIPTAEPETTEQPRRKKKGGNREAKDAADQARREAWAAKQAEWARKRDEREAAKASGGGKKKGKGSGEPKKPTEYRIANEVAALADEIMSNEPWKDSLAHLAGASILYLFTSQESFGKEKIGQARLFPKMLTVLYDFQYIVVLSFPFWDAMPDKRKALLYHELLHCDVDVESGRPKLREHDLEEFGQVIEKCGLWDDATETMAEIMGLAASRPAPELVEEDEIDELREPEDLDALRKQRAADQ